MCMPTPIDQKEYLKKYLSGGKKSKKEKKKKKKSSGDGKSKRKGLNLIEDSVDINEIPFGFGEEDDAPTIAEITYEDENIRLLDDFKARSGKWKNIEHNNPDDDRLSSTSSDHLAKRNESSDTNFFSFDQNDSPPHKKGKERGSRENSDNSPPRIKEYDSQSFINGSKKQNHSDLSPPRKSDTVSYLPKQRPDPDSSHRIKKGHDSNVSPSRRKKYNSDDSTKGKKQYTETSSRKKRQDFEASPRRKRHDSDGSPPRKQRHDSDTSPPKRKRHDSDESPPRKQRRDPDASPPRRKKDSDASPGRKRHDSDASPPRRKRHDSDTSPPRKKKHDYDASLPRKKRHDSDASSPRRKRHDSDASPPRKKRHDSDASSPRKKRHDSDASSPRRQRHDSDASPPRRKRHDSDPSPPRRKRYDSDPSPPRRSRHDSDSSPPRKPTNNPANKPVSDKRPEKKLTTREYLRQRKMGKLKQETPEDLLRQEREADLQRKANEKYKDWNKGVVQTRLVKERIQDTIHEMGKSFSRSADDQDMNDKLKGVMREEDPMLEYIMKKKAKDNPGGQQLPIYKGSFPPNRFQIRPGYRWDGVDRSSGYEQAWFSKQNAKRAVDSDSYKWSTEDM